MNSWYESASPTTHDEQRMNNHGMDNRNGQGSGTKLDDQAGDDGVCGQKVEADSGRELIRVLRRLGQYVNYFWSWEDD